VEAALIQLGLESEARVGQAVVAMEKAMLSVTQEPPTQAVVEAGVDLLSHQRHIWLAAQAALA
jgi:hypothetical protein